MQTLDRRMRSAAMRFLVIVVPLAIVAPALAATGGETPMQSDDGGRRGKPEEAPHQTTKLGRLEGIVEDQHSHAPLVGAIVAWRSGQHNMQGTTNASGRYAFAIPVSCEDDGNRHSDHDARVLAPDRPASATTVSSRHSPSAARSAAAQAG